MPILRPSGSTIQSVVVPYYVPSTAWDTDGNGFVDQDVVSNIWYIPPIDSNGLSLTPVYVTVREL